MTRGKKEKAETILTARETETETEEPTRTSDQYTEATTDDTNDETNDKTKSLFLTSLKQEMKKGRKILIRV